MVETLKNDLEAQKKEVDRVIADQELQQKAIEATKRREEELVATYRANASAYAAESAAAKKIKEAEIAEAIRKNNSTGAVGNGANTYPKRGNCPQDNLGYLVYGGYVCQCVSYTGWKVFERYGIRISAWGNANQWHNTARKLGYRVDHTPEAGSVAISTAGPYGHAMWVEAVNPNGTINLSEYNNSYSSASHRAGDFGYRVSVSTSGMWFIHF
jgi:surface antigen